jgi:hypothetical protein
MASSPELAPGDQNHLLRTSSVIKKIKYKQGAIIYKKFDERSEERFKLGAWEPGSIEGGEMHWDAATRVLSVTATSKAVTISRRVQGAGQVGHAT